MELCQNPERQLCKVTQKCHAMSYYASRSYWFNFENYKMDKPTNTFT